MAHIRFRFQAPECDLIYSNYNSISAFQFLSQIPRGTRCRLQALYNLSECSYQSSDFIVCQPVFIQEKLTERTRFYYSSALVHIHSMGLRKCKHVLLLTTAAAHEIADFICGDLNETVERATCGCGGAAETVCD